MRGIGWVGDGVDEGMGWVGAGVGYAWVGG